jgi:peptidoglycan/LPS O-acetylase OafA/YrhL
MVVFHHISEPPYGMLASFFPVALTQTWAGVDLFFVISGFVVFRSLVRTDWKSFYMRRFWRIVPLALFWALLPLIVVAAMAPASGSPLVAQTIRDVGGIVTLTFNYSLAYSHQFNVLLAPYWSLCIEEHFYLLLPLTLAILPGRRAQVALSLSLLALTPLVLRPLVLKWTDPAYFYRYYRFASHCRFDGLALGVLLALLQGSRPVRFLARVDRTWLRRGIASALSLTLVAALALYPSLMVDKNSYNWGLSVITVISGILVWMASLNRGYVFEVPFVSDLLAWVGQRSYVIYLAHMPLYLAAMRLFSQGFVPVTTAGIFSVAVLYSVVLAVVAELCHRVIERPFIAFGRRFRFPRGGWANVQHQHALAPMESGPDFGPGSAPVVTPPITARYS